LFKENRDQKRASGGQTDAVFVVHLTLSTSCVANAFIVNLMKFKVLAKQYMHFMQW